jgi:dTDP-4-dehydrorhamnose reductase
LAKKIGAQFIHVSTDHFFSKAEVPRNESEQVIPINQYGFTKMAAEKTILKQNERALILRTNFFGHSEKESKSILDFAINSVKINKVINGFDDVLFTPVGVSEISNFLINPISLNARGLLNFASSETISKYDFMVMVSQVLKKYDAIINRASISSSKLIVPRPNYLALSATRLTNEFAYNLPSIQEMLENEIAGII